VESMFDRIDMEEAKKMEGQWRWPSWVSKPHYFMGRRSLCGLVIIIWDSPYWAESKAPLINQRDKRYLCKTCFKLFKIRDRGRVRNAKP